MFWKRKKSRASDQALILRAYLNTVMPMVSPKLQDPAVRAGVQVFVLGMVDMIRQTEKLAWDDCLAIYEQTLTEANILPSVSVASLVEKVEQATLKSENVEKLMRHGAQSISMYVAERDANAPTDLLSVVMFSEKNSADLSGLA